MWIVDNVEVVIAGVGVVATVFILKNKKTTSNKFNNKNDATRLMVQYKRSQEAINSRSKFSFKR